MCICYGAAGFAAIAHDDLKPVPRSPNAQNEYEGPYNGAWGPTQEVLTLAESPFDRFWFFMPKKLFCLIVDESNRYADQTLLARAKRIRDKQAASMRRGTRRRDVETLKKIRQ